MTKITKKGLSWILAVVMLVSLFPVSAFALASSDFELVGDTVTIDGSADATAEVAFTPKSDIMVVAIQGKFSESNEGITMSDIEFPVALTGQNGKNTETGELIYTDENFTGFSVSAGEPIITAKYTVDKNIRPDDYTVDFELTYFMDGNFDDINTATYSAQIVVEKPAAPASPYEIYYKLNSDVDADSDKYADLGNFAQGQQVTADIYLKSNDATVTVQAYDIYLTYDSNLTYVSSDLTGTPFVESGVLKHIQLVKDANNYITLAKGAEVKLGTVTFNVANSVKYGDPLPITLTVGTSGKTVTNIALAEDQKSYYPTDASAFKGVEITTTYEVKYFDGVDDTVITVPEDQVKEYNKSLTLSTEKPQRDGYTFKEWSGSDGKTYAAGATYEGNADLTLTAQWTRNTVTVRWYNATGSEIYNEPVEIGAKAVFGGETPTKAPTAEFTYKFEGWNTDKNAEVALSDLTVTQNTDFYPIFSKTLRTYTVTWYNQDGSNPLETDDAVEYGAAPVFDSEDPVKTADAQYTYTFAGWATSAGQESGTPEANLPTVTGETSYYAAFSKSLNKYEVTFSTAYGTAPVAQTVAYGSKATNPGTLTADHYNFGGWYTDEACTAAYDFNTEITGKVTLYAKWTPKTYTVTFAAGEGSGSMNPQSFTYGEAQTLTANGFTAPTGKTFDGWKDQNGATYTDKQSISLTENLTLTAQWSSNSYTIQADAAVQNGTVGVDKNSANYGDTITVTVAPAEGYEIDKVTYTPAGGNAVEVPAQNGTYSFNMPAANVTVSATFKKADLTVNVGTVNNGTVNIENGETDVTEKTDAKVGDTIILNVTPNTGYQVKSVTYIKTGDSSATAANATANADGTYSFTMPTYGVTVNVEFEVVHYTIAFDGNGATSGSMNPIENVAYGAEQKLTVNAFTKNGYKFAGWLYNGTTYGDETTVKNLIAVNGETVTLVAQWTVATYGITLNTNGGDYTEGYTAPQNYTFGTGVILPTKDELTKDGYTLTGWYDNENCTGEAVTMIGSDAYGEKVYWAKWTEATYTVTLNTNGGQIAEGKNVTEYTYGTEVNLPTAEDMTKNGYTFAGWYDNEGTPVEKIPVGTFGEKTYNAKWDLVTYTITFNVNGGTAIAPMTYNIESSVTLPDATKAGYTFAGWSLSEKVGNWEATVYNAGTAITEKYGNVTLEAQWTRAITATVEEYKYANGTGYRLLLVDATGLAEGDVYKFGGETMYYTDDVNYLIDKDNDTGVFYLLIAEKTNLVKNGDIYTNELTEEAYGKLTVATETRKELDYNGDINGDGVVNIADANAVYQMVLAGGSYYSLDQLTLEMRLLADMDKDDTGATAEARASIMDVDAILTVING